MRKTTKKRPKKPKQSKFESPSDSEKIKQLFNAFSNSVRPEQKISIIDWAHKYVHLSRSSRSEQADLRLTPWLIQPIEAIIDNEHNEIGLLAPVGSGKTTLFEIIACYIVAQRPGPTLFAVQSNEDAAEWAQIGLVPALKKCKQVDPFWLKTKSSIKKDLLQFNHMVMWIGGSNMTNFQAKSCDYVFIDEAWLLKAGLINEARRRTHDRFGSKFVCVSQGGTVSCDFDLFTKNCFVKEYHYYCDKCEQYHPYDFNRLKFAYDKNDNEEIIWDSVTAHFECVCGTIYNDSVNDRRKLSESGKYLSAPSNNPLQGHILFHYNALAVWWITWKKLAQEFLKANQQVKAGNLEPLKQFLQKRLAQHWDEVSLLSDQEIKLTPIDSTPLDINILTVDVQKDELWYVLRTWSRSGESKLLEHGKMLTFNDVKKKQEEYKLLSNSVFIDAAYRTEEVKIMLAKEKWIGLNGRSEPHYTVLDKRTGRKYKRIYGHPNRHKTQFGDAIICYYSSFGIKDVLFILKSGHGTKWDVPTDVNEDYIKQLNSEVKMIGADGRPFYKQLRRDNHYLDCESMSIVAAIMHNCYPNIILDEETVEETS